MLVEGIDGQGPLKFNTESRTRCVVKHNLITEVYLMTM